jgi:hemerythrin-like domain-containing protein
VKESKPLTRSKQLAPLSREHHDGLLFVWKIRQGLQNKVDYDRLRSYTHWFWQNHMKPHFFQEERILLPYLPAEHQLAAQLKNEHAHIRELIIEIDKHHDPRNLTILCDLLDKHIRFEERELFTYFQDELTSTQLDTIFEQLQKHPVSCNDPANWTDEFWVKPKA